MSYIYNYHIFNNIISPTIPHRQGLGNVQSAFNKSTDFFVTSPINNENKLTDKDNIIKCASSNPNILSILKKYNIPLKPNTEELEKLQQGHLKETRVLAAKIYSNLPSELKKEVNPIDLQTAAMLHDYGKVLIPNKILNKKEALTPQEKEIIEQHSELGYELLKEQGINPNVLNLIKYHHQNSDGSGYPNADTNFEYNTSLAILQCADKYSALSEERSYKNAMPAQECLEIMQDEVKNGNLPSEVFFALTKAIKQ